MAISSSVSLHVKLPIPYTKAPFHRFSSNSRLVPTKISSKCCFQTSKSVTLFKCCAQRQSSELKNEEIKGKVDSREQVYEFERLFSNLNQATLKREPGISLFSSPFGLTYSKFMLELWHEFWLIRSRKFCGATHISVF